LIYFTKNKKQKKLCAEDAKKSFLFTRIGTNYKKKCTINVAEEIDKLDTTYFYDICKEYDNFYIY